MIEDWLIFTALALTALATTMAAGALLQTHRLGRRLAALEARTGALQDDVRGLCTGAVGLGRRVHAMEREALQMTRRLEERTSRGRSYDQAVRLAQRGSPLEDLISVCGLSRGEAELITMMQRLDRERERSAG